jgi:hypothetical protein
VAEWRSVSKLVLSEGQPQRLWLSPRRRPDQRPPHQPSRRRGPTTCHITSLPHPDKSSGDRFVKDLNKAEDATNSAKTELATRPMSLDTAKTNLSNLIDSFQIDETI